jgi:hypothetical protein
MDVLFEVLSAVRDAGKDRLLLIYRLLDRSDDNWSSVARSVTLAAALVLLPTLSLLLICVVVRLLV